MSERILIAMSGGVDSSVAAVLLLEQGHAVAGATLRLGHRGDDDAVVAARRACDHIGITHHVVDAGEEFRRRVVDEFAREYLSGRTPNPCIVCNERVKFGLLLDKASGLGYGRIATGHYARVACAPDARGTMRCVLLKGKDARKEQSYVLYRLGQGTLARIVLPLGFLTKDEVRALAAERRLAAADRPESQEICFVERDYVSFLRSYVPDFDRSVRPGPIIDREGRVLGTHRGLPYYTVGQRSGLGIAHAYPLYVVRLDAAANTIVAGNRDDVFVPGMELEQVTWVSGEAPELPLRADVKIRYQHGPVPAVLSGSGEDRASLSVAFETPQPSVTPGQSAVFYEGDRVLGGGVIRKSRFHNDHSG